MAEPDSVYMSAADYVWERYGIALSPDDLADLEVFLQEVHIAHGVPWLQDGRPFPPELTPDER